MPSIFSLRFSPDNGHNFSSITEIKRRGVPKIARRSGYCPAEKVSV